MTSATDDYQRNLSSHVWSSVNDGAVRKNKNRSHSFSLVHTQHDLQILMQERGMAYQLAGINQPYQWYHTSGVYRCTDTRKCWARLLASSPGPTQLLMCNIGRWVEPGDEATRLPHLIQIPGGNPLCPLKHTSFLGPSEEEGVCGSRRGLGMGQRLHLSMQKATHICTTVWPLHHDVRYDCAYFYIITSLLLFALILTYHSLLLVFLNKVFCW